MRPVGPEYLHKIPSNPFNSCLDNSVLTKIVDQADCYSHAVELIMMFVSRSSSDAIYWNLLTD